MNLYFHRVFTESLVMGTSYQKNFWRNPASVQGHLAAAGPVPLMVAAMGQLKTLRANISVWSAVLHQALMWQL